MERKELYQEKMEAQLREWRAKIDELKAKAQHASADAKLQYEQQLATLRPRLEAAQQKFQELKTSSESAWGDVRTGMEGAWSELRRAWDKAVSQFK